MPWPSKRDPNVFYFYFMILFDSTIYNRNMSRANTSINTSPATVSDVQNIVTRAIEDFAIIVGRGFAETHEQIQNIRENMVTKSEFSEFKAEMYEFKAEMYDFKTEMHDFKANIMEFKNSAEPVLFSLQTDMIDVKRHLGKVETGIVELREEATSSRIAVIGILKDHEDRITQIEAHTALS